MAWIESHQELARHPKTKRFARLAEISIPCAIGHLHLLWWWCMSYAEDGNLSKWEASDIADAVLWENEPEKLLENLINAGFIDCLNGQRTVHDWDDYTGKLMEFRRKDRERKRKSVKNPSHSTVTQPNRTEPNQTKPNMTATEPDQPNQPIHAGDGVAVGIVNDGKEVKTITSTEKNDEAERLWFTFWNNYPKKTGEEEARIVWLTLNPDVATATKIIQALEIAKQSDQWIKDNGRFINKAVNWLKNKSWEGDTTDNEPNRRNNSAAGFDPDGMSGFHNALDKYDDDGNEIAADKTK
jgi:hypothetical protein